MAKRKTKLQKRISRLVREKYELLRKVEQLLKELKIVKQEHQRKGPQTCKVCGPERKT